MKPSKVWTEKPNLGCTLKAFECHATNCKRETSEIQNESHLEGSSHLNVPLGAGTVRIGDGYE